MLWKNDDQVDAARRQPGWQEFHRACGRHQLYFDHIEREGRRGSYKAPAFTLERTRRGEPVTIHLADGVGKTPTDALVDAYRKAGRPVADAELDRLLGADLDALLGGDLDDILG